MYFFPERSVSFGVKAIAFWCIAYRLFFIGQGLAFWGCVSFSDRTSILPETDKHRIYHLSLYILKNNSGFTRPQHPWSSMFKSEPCECGQRFWPALVQRSHLNAVLLLFIGVWNRFGKRHPPGGPQYETKRHRGHCHYGVYRSGCRDGCGIVVGIIICRRL